MDNPKIQAQGRLERAGGSRYPYGSHALVPQGERVVRFVLRSDTIELRELEGREVRVTGSVMEGHPPPKEGDPKLLEVFAITPIEQE